MKRFISIVGFLLLFFAGKADTISRVHVYLNDSLIYDAYEGQLIKIKLKIDGLKSTDTLRFENYYGCGGRPAANSFLFTLSDPYNEKQLYQDKYTAHDFSFSLGLIREFCSKDPRLREISGSYRASGNGRMSGGISFVILLE